MGKSMIAVPPYMLAQMKQLRDEGHYNSIAEMLEFAILPTLEGYLPLSKQPLEILETLHNEHPTNRAIRSAYLAKRAGVVE